MNRVEGLILAAIVLVIAFGIWAWIRGNAECHAMHGHIDCQLVTMIFNPDGTSVPIYDCKCVVP